VTQEALSPHTVLAAAVDLVMHVALRLIIDAGRGAVHCRANYKPRPRARAATYSIKSAKVVIGSCSIGRMCIYAELLIGASSGDCTPMHSNANNTRTLARSLAFVLRFRSRPAFEIAHPSKPRRMQHSTAHAFDRSLNRLNISIVFLIMRYYILEILVSVIYQILLD
jgi:hypothetical protein